jgi:hypothetical protein
LKTLLSEIGVSEEYRRRRQGKRISSAPESDYSAPAPQRKSKDRETADYEPRRKASEDLLVPKRVSKEYNKDIDTHGRVMKKMSSSGQNHPRQRKPSRGDPPDRRTSHRTERSVDSYTGEKEAIYQVSESDDQHHYRGRQTTGPQQGMGAPSPGEGLRNALGNLETRINSGALSGRDTELRVNETHARQEIRRGRPPSDGKGFATMVEELVKPCARNEMRGLTSTPRYNLLICR